VRGRAALHRKRRERYCVTREKPRECWISRLARVLQRPERAGAKDGPFFQIRKEQIMKATNSFGTATANVLIMLAPALIGPIAVAEGFADVTKPIAVEIDRAVMRIDIAAAIRALRESLSDARIVAPEMGGTPDDVKLAVAEAHDRG
jgi:hypothetical protein